MLCTVPDIPENHYNMKIMFDMTNLNVLKFKFVADFKLLLICWGCQNAVATHPCPYCRIKLEQLRDHSRLDKLKQIPFSDLRTIESLKASNKSFMDDFDVIWKSAHNANKVVNAPLIEDLGHISVLERSPPEELHLLQGFVNHTFFKGLVPLVGREIALRWPMKLNLVSAGYHGEVFEGNAARKLLKTADTLMSKDILGQVPPLVVLPYVEAYKAMDKVVSG